MCQSTGINSRAPHGITNQINHLSSGYVSVVLTSAVFTRPGPRTQRQLVTYCPALGTDARGTLESRHDIELPSVPFGLVGKLPSQLVPAAVPN